MCEIQGEQMQNATAPDLTGAEIATLPTRRTWYGIVSPHHDYIVPSELTDNAELAKAQCIVRDAKYPSLGPWSVVTLTENLRTPV